MIAENPFADAGLASRRDRVGSVALPALVDQPGTAAEKTRFQHVGRVSLSLLPIVAKASRASGEMSGDSEYAVILSANVTIGRRQRTAPGNAVPGPVIATMFVKPSDGRSLWE